jgi:hypothetical protein
MYVYYTLNHLIWTHESFINNVRRDKILPIASTEVYAKAQLTNRQHETWEFRALTPQKESVRDGRRGGKAWLLSKAKFAIIREESGS